MRYFKLCPDCNGKGETRRHKHGQSVSILYLVMCENCHMGYVDCTKEVEAIKAELAELRASVAVTTVKE